MSGSLDGSVNLWRTDTLEGTTPLFSGQNIVEQEEKRGYVYKVNDLKRLSDHHLAVCLGNGFRVYDIRHKECILDVPNAHSGACVTSIIPIYGG